MTNWKMWAMMLVAIFAFSACGTDEEAGESTKPPDVFTGKRLTQLSYKYSENREDREEITYANNKLTKYAFVEISEIDGRFEEVYDVTYSENKVRMYHKSTTSKDSGETLYTLNAEGYATSATVTDVEDKSEEGVSTLVTNQTFEYANGYLTKIVSTGSDGRVLTIEIAYSDGDVTSYSTTRDGLMRTYAYTVSNSVNKGGILPPDNAWFDCDGNLEMGYYAGILGKPTKHLVAKVQVGTDAASECNYTFDNDYVKTMEFQSVTASYIFQ